MRKILIVISGIYLCLISLFVILGLVLGFLSLKASATEDARRMMPYFMVSATMNIIFAAWALITAAGILMKKNWARYSLSIISAFAILIGLLVLLAIVFSLFGGVRGSLINLIISLLIVIVILIVVPVFFLIFFNSKEVIAEFKTGKAAYSGSARPLGVSVISVLCFISAFSLLVNVFLAFPKKIPFLPGIFLTGVPLRLYFLLMMLLNIYLGLRLLKMKRTGWLVSVYFFAYSIAMGIINVFSLSKDYLSEILCEMKACESEISMGVFRLMGSLGLLVPLAILFYLLSRKKFFQK